MCIHLKIVVYKADRNADKKGVLWREYERWIQTKLCFPELSLYLNGWEKKIAACRLALHPISIVAHSKNNNSLYERTNTIIITLTTSDWMADWQNFFMDLYLNGFPKGGFVERNQGTAMITVNTHNLLALWVELSYRNTEKEKDFSSFNNAPMSCCYRLFFIFAAEMFHFLKKEVQEEDEEWVDMDKLEKSEDTLVSFIRPILFSVLSLSLWSSHCPHTTTFLQFTHFEQCLFTQTTSFANDGTFFA